MSIRQGAGKISTRMTPWLALGALVVSISLGAAGPAETFPGLADPGQPISLTMQAGNTQESVNVAAPVVIRGPEARLQIVATARYSSGQVRDWTQQVTYSAAPAGIVQIEPSGAITPLSNGSARITATGERGLNCWINVTVERFDSPTPVNFPNQITPIFTKLGCNSGGCHGKSGGQNGFRLSLLGFEPAKDYRYLAKESRGRRIFPAAPDESLLLLKSTNMLAHGGGERLKLDSREYRLIRRWISQGMPYGGKDDPSLAGVSVFPTARTLPRDGQQQLLVIAHYSDGSSEDVTHTAQYEPNDKDMAEISNSGRVKTMGRPGDVAVMVRYQGQVGVFQATVPLGASVKDLPKARGFIDELVFAKLVELGLPPSAVCDDATFLRRVTLDIAGRLPTSAEARAFLVERDAGKRDRCIDRLLASDAYGDYFAGKWSAILRNKREKETYQRGNYLFHEWLRNSLLANKPYDQFVRELLTASGDVGQTPAVNWYREVDDANKQVEDTAQLFMGLRIQCARCHHHPFEKWSQQDYYGLSAFFSRVGRKEGQAVDEFRIYHKRGVAMARNPANGKDVKPAGLGGGAIELSSDDDPRVALADWLTAKDNPFFARALVNRYWKHFLGHGLVEAEDDMRETNPPSNPKLLDALAQHFVASGYDMKELIRSICQSQAYQLSSAPNDYNGRDRQSFSHFYARRLSAEVLLDAIDQLNGTTTKFAGLAMGERAVQLPDLGGVDTYFLKVFGRPVGASACECERNGESSLAQSLQLLNSNDMYDKLKSGRASQLASAQDTRADAAKVNELYLTAFSRLPRQSELNSALAHIQKAPAKDKQAAYEDLLWALTNTKEFLFTH